VNAGGRIRIGVVDYLNMQPLTFGLEAAHPGRVDLFCGPPSRLAQWLDAGKIDMGMVPVGTLLARPDWRIVTGPDGNGSIIGARGPVASVLLLGGGAPGQWRRLRPDSHSVTSNALARILLARRYGLKPAAGETIPMEGWSPPERPATDEAMVLIGSRALRWRRWGGEGSTVLDMAEEWRRLTGMPIVFAAWVARPGVELGEWPALLEAHKRANRARIDAIAAAWPGLDYDGLTTGEAAAYLRGNVDYELDGAARRGLERFIAECRALELLPSFAAR
jgi:chorismate dehydratase